MKIHKRQRGQTAIYETWEWIYAPYGLRPATWRQIQEECRKGAHIHVIQWPEGRDVFRNGSFLNADLKSKFDYEVTT
jgi:hypothetical protein